MSRLLIIAAVAASALTFAAGAQAQESTLDSYRTVSTRDVNFNDARQTHDFYVKLRGAARQACDELYGDLEHSIQQRQCESAAMADAVRQVNAPQLSQLDASARRAAPQQAQAQAQVLAANDR